MSKKLKIGDLVEVRTGKGLGYAQYTLAKPQWGNLIRILPGIHDKRPPNLESLINQEEVFWTFIPLQAVVSRNIFQIVGNFEVPASAKQFPLMRVAGLSDRQGRVKDWWLWDGEKEWKIEKLTEEYRKLSIQSVWNDTALIEAMEQGWTPDKDPRS